MEGSLWRDGMVRLFVTAVRKHLAALVVVIVSRRRQIPISGCGGRLGWAWKVTKMKMGWRMSVGP
jgi:hypothetical protein